MANPISPQVVRGTVAELLVQLRLLQFDVQAAPPIKDSGNDLIAVRYKTFKTIQVKAAAVGKRYSVANLPENYDLLAVVYLQGEDTNLLLDQSKIFLIPKSEVKYVPRNIRGIKDFEMDSDKIDSIFGNRHWTGYGTLT